MGTSCLLRIIRKAGTIHLWSGVDGYFSGCGDTICREIAKLLKEMTPAELSAAVEAIRVTSEKDQVDGYLRGGLTFDFEQLATIIRKAGKRPGKPARTAAAAAGKTGKPAPPVTRKAAAAADKADKPAPPVTRAAAAAAALAAAGGAGAADAVMTMTSGSMCSTTPRTRSLSTR